MLILKADSTSNLKGRNPHGAPCGTRNERPPATVAEEDSRAISVKRNAESNRGLERFALLHVEVARRTFCGPGVEDKFSMMWIAKDRHAVSQ